MFFFQHCSFLNALVAYLLPVMMTFAWLAGLALATYNLVLDREDGQEEVYFKLFFFPAIDYMAV